MSRKIDLTQPLSDEDREWLLTNGYENKIRENEANLSGDFSAIIDESTPDEHTGTPLGTENPSVVAQTADPVPTPDQAVLSALTAAPSAQTTDPAEGEAASDGDADDDSLDNYDDEAVWPYSDLVEEYKARIEAGSEKGPKYNAAREEIISWLREDDLVAIAADASNPEA